VEHRERAGFRRIDEDRVEDPHLTIIEPMEGSPYRVQAPSSGVAVRRVPWVIYQVWLSLRPDCINGTTVGRPFVLITLDYSSRADASRISSLSDSACVSVEIGLGAA